MRHGSLFSGIGGFDLAAEWMGWKNIFHCEWNEFGQRVLKYNWPNAESFTDITKTDFRKYANQIDVLTGGFPCQPYSSAGKRLGKEDDRHLWPEMLRAIREIKPTFIVGENVYGLINWNEGMVFHEVQVDLENEGYEVQPCVLPACAVNAPHRRDRVWFIAYSNNLLHKGELEHRGHRGEEARSEGENKCEREAYDRQRVWAESSTSSQNATNSECKRQQESGQSLRSLRSETNREWKASWSYNDGRWPVESPICSGNDGISSELDGITFPKWRQESIKAYGNAIVPQVAYMIFQALIATQEGRAKKYSEKA